MRRELEMPYVRGAASIPHVGKTNKSQVSITSSRDTDSIISLQSTNPGQSTTHRSPYSSVFRVHEHRIFCVVPSEDDLVRYKERNSACGGIPKEKGDELCGSAGVLRPLEWHDASSARACWVLRTEISVALNFDV